MAKQPVGEVKECSINDYAEFPVYKGFQGFSDMLQRALLKKSPNVIPPPYLHRGGAVFSRNFAFIATT